MNSIEKIEQLEHAFTSSAPSPDAGAAELALRTGLQMLGPTLRAELPASPGDLDDLLERGAAFLLSMRSDDAHAIELVPGAIELGPVHAGNSPGLSETAHGPG